MTHSFKWEQMLRFRLIELISLWEGRLTTNHICTAFKIGRQQASRDIAAYRKFTGDNQLILDQRIRGYRPSATFRPRFIKGNPGEYLAFLHERRRLDDCVESTDCGFHTSEIIELPDRSVSPTIIRSIVQACRNSQRLDVEYVSLSTPIIRGRVITPHTIVYDGVRWHVRAHCEEKGQYRDFVLSRFRGEPEMIGASNNTQEGDDAWNTYIDLTITPNPYLTIEQQEIVAYDYNMQNGQLTLKAREPLKIYYQHKFNLVDDNSLIKTHPTRYQLVLDSTTELLE